MKEQADMGCPECGTRMKTRRENLDFDCGLEGADIVLEGVEVRRCPDCGAEAMGIDNPLGLQQRIALELIHRPNRLGAHEVAFLRQHLGLAVTEFARWMGVSGAVARGWERAADPEAMGATADRLLRLMVAQDAGMGFPLERLEATGKGRPLPLRMRLRCKASNWTEIVEAAPEAKQAPAAKGRGAAAAAPGAAVPAGKRPARRKTQ